MRRGRSSSEEGQWIRFGFLFADLFTALAMVFLLANTSAQGTSSNTQQQCGIQRQPVAPITFTVSDADTLRKKNKGAEQAFSVQVRSGTATYAGRVVGLAEVFGGSYRGVADVADGMTLAKGAIDALSSPAGASDTGAMFSPSDTVFQSYWDGDLNGQQVKVILFFYQTATGAACQPS